MRIKCVKDLKEGLRNAVIFIEFQAFKDLYVHVSSSLGKKNLILTDLFIKVLATLPKQVHHQSDRNIFQAWICLMGFKHEFQAWMMSTISNIITYISKFSVQKRI